MDKKKLILIVFCLIITVVNAQVRLDAGVTKTFNNVSNSLSPDYKLIISKQELANGKSILSEGYLIYTTFKTDTLNRKDRIIYPGTVKILSLHTDGAGEKIQKQGILADRDENVNMPIPYRVVLKEDTVILETFPLFWPYETLKVVKQKVVGFYEDYSRKDTIYKLRSELLKTEKISVPLKVTLKLSTVTFKPGQDVYGEAEFTSNPYYVDDASFKSGYIKKRLHVKYVFRVIIRDKNHPVPSNRY